MTVNKVKEILQNKDNRNVIINAAGAFAVKGLAILVSVATIPAYMRFFHNENVLGVWYTVLSLIQWIFMFDLGIGQGLRNKLAELVAKNNDKESKKYISSAYLLLFAICVVIVALYLLCARFIPWNSVLNISENELSRRVLQKSMNIIFVGIIIQFLLRLITSILYAIQKSAVVNLLTLLSNTIILIYILNRSPGSYTDSLIQLSYVNVIAVNLPLLVTTIIVFSTSLKKCRPSVFCYNHGMAVEVLKMGMIMFYLQFAWLVVTGLHSLLISQFSAPGEVVEYQVYYKIYNTIASILSMALVPIWSAVTKAMVENKWKWIYNIYWMLLLASAAVLVLECMMLPLVQPIVNIWLRKEAIPIQTGYCVIMTIYSVLFLIHTVNTSIGNGLSFFRVQNIWMGFAAVVMVPLSYIFCKLFDSWIGVILAGFIAVLPFEILQPVKLFQYLKTRLEIAEKSS